MNKLKSFWGWIVAGVGGIVGVLVYVLMHKKKRLKTLEAQLRLVNTQKQADVLEIQINEHKKNTKLLKKEIDDLDEAKKQLKNKRKELEEKHKEMSPESVEQYWND